ncbi:MAG TPA: S-adenosyl-l-methionine hydroxide adenosyltransferase family protein [Chitinophagaceae bacterium]|nr:S-adenosyl-l-methionine hydroxide adenosyltransferase family protein [Chitinophagaceae bacterium]
MRYYLFIIVCLIASCGSSTSTPSAIVFQTDFGVKDGAVSAMKGVAHDVDPGIPLYDLTHEIPAYNIWEAAYRLNQTAPYWPKGTIFVSVVDPGVGTARRPVVLKTRSGHYVVSPDNGTLGLIVETLGLEEIRLIDTLENRRQGSAGSHTFHGRDIFAFTAARLAAGEIGYEKVGPLLEKQAVEEIVYQKAAIAGNSIKGNIPVLDIQYGNVWSNIPDSLVAKSGIAHGDSLDVIILHKSNPIFTGRMPFVRTFGDVPEGRPLGYINSLGNFSVAINMGNFADSFKVASGAEWSIMVK